MSTTRAAGRFRFQLRPTGFAHIREGGPADRTGAGVLGHRRSAFRAQGLPAGRAGVGLFRELRPATGAASRKVQAAVGATFGPFGDAGVAARADEGELGPADRTRGSSEGDDRLAIGAARAGFRPAPRADELIRPEPGTAPGAEPLAAGRARPLRWAKKRPAVRANGQGCGSGGAVGGRTGFQGRRRGDRGLARWTALRRAEEGLLAGRATPGENPPAVRAFRRRAQQNGPATRAGEGQLEAAPSASRLRCEGLFGSGLPAHRAPDRAARGAQNRLRRHGLAAARAGGLPGRRAAGRAAGRALRQRSPALRAHLPQGQPARRARGGVRRHPRAAIGAGLGAAARARLVGRHHRPAAAARPGPQGRAARWTGLRFRRDGRVTVAAEPGPDRPTSGAAIRILRHGGSARRAESGPTVGANALLREDLPAASRAGDELDHAVGAPLSGFALPPGRPVQPSARWARASARFRQ
jgi:hypothetical protein